MKRDKKYFIKKISNYAIVGGLGSLLLVGFSGCENKTQEQSGGELTDVSEKKNVFVVIEKDASGSYKIIDEFPSTNTTIVLRENGTERTLSKEEIDKLVKEEEVKIDNNTSNLTKSEVSSGGMSLGETLLASAAGAMIGAYIGNKLFNNSNYENQRRTNYKSPQTYSKSVNNFNKSTTPSASNNQGTNNNGKSGYFNNQNSSGKATSSSGFGS